MKSLVNENSLRKIIYQEMRSFLEKNPIIEELGKIEKELSLISELESLEKEIKSINECNMFDGMDHDDEIEIDEVISDPNNNEPIFQIKGSSLIEGGDESSENEDAKWDEFEKALNEMGKPALQEDFRGEDEDDVVHIEYDKDGNVNFGEPLPSGMSTFKKASDDWNGDDDYSKLYTDLSEKMDFDQAKEVVDSIKEKEKKDKELQEAFDRMKRFIQ